MSDSVNVWYDAEGDFPEVVLEVASGCYEPTADDRVMVKISEQGKLIAFSVMGLAKPAEGGFLDLDLSPESVDESMYAETASGGGDA